MCHWIRFVASVLACLPFAGRPASLLAQPLVAPSEALSPAEQQQKFRLPPGFEIQLVAAEPDIFKPMNITFDGQGRLWLADTLEYPYPAAEGAAPRDTVKVLEDRDHNGSAETITTFADGLNIPLGVLPIPRGAIVYSIGAVRRLLDTDGDGRADTRDVLYGGFGSRDTHGMVNSFTRGLDGWIYACHGFANDSNTRGSDGHAIAMSSGNTFRMRLDGARVEQHTHGQVNPFGLCFDPLGNLYSADCHTMPIYMLLRGAYYPSFGKPHDGLGFGPTMIAHNHQSTGIGGIAYYSAEQFPSEYRDTIFIGNPVTGRVNHDRLEPRGSTYEAVELPDFITCDDPWFRPVNLQVGLDGALYVADFYNCIIGHYEVPLEHPRRDRHRGRIWRVVYTGKGVAQPPAVAAPRGPNLHAAELDQLVALLAHANLTVRTLATHEIVDRLGTTAVEPLRQVIAAADSSPFARVHAMWALEHLKSLADDELAALAGDDDRAVRVHLMRLVGERAWHTSALALAALDDSDPFVRRAAAEALGRHPHSSHVRPLAALWSATPPEDTHLVHVARMALRDQLLADGVYDAVRPLAAADAQLFGQLADVSLGVPNAQSAAWVFDYLRQARELPPARQNDFFHHVVRHAAADELSPALELARCWKPGSSPVEHAELARSVSRALQERGAEVPAATADWVRALCARLLASQHEAEVRAGIDLARDCRAGSFDALARAAGREARFAALRRDAMDVCADYDGERAVDVLRAILTGDEPMDLRQWSAALLGRINTEPARQQLLASLQTAPESLAVALAAPLAGTRRGAEALLASVAAGQASPWLLQERTVAHQLRAHNWPALTEQLAALTADLPARDERIDKLIEARRALVAGRRADAAQGAAVFEKHCATCHRIGERGAKIGPNLDGVGIRGVDRLLEDVLDPSRNVDQAFRTAQIVTTDGRNLVGLVLRDEGQVVVLVDGQGKELRVPQDEIEARALSQLSVMPANVPELISEAEFVDLIGYLVAQRSAPAP